ncbi:stress protein [Pseudofrankia sp. EUN1h]|nr:stress protein [Pseudofrankia sp. EUN1h]
MAKGANTVLGDRHVEIIVSWPAADAAGRPSPSLDVCALRLDANGRAREDADLVFFNAPSSPDGSVRHRGRTPDGAGEAVTVDINRQPADVASIVITATVDVATPHLTFGGLTVSARVTGLATGTELVRFTPPRLDAERALILVEIYRRSGAWKIRAVGQGYASGLAGLATDYGIDISADVGVAAAPFPVTVSAASVSAVSAASVSAVSAASASAHAAAVLPPRSAAAADPPSTESSGLDMRTRLDLRKRTVHTVLTGHGIPEHRARVALALDASGSMTTHYQTGIVARVVERVAAVAATMDDDATLDVWSYATMPLALPPLRADQLAEWIPLYVRMSYPGTGQGGRDATLARERAARAAGRRIPRWYLLGEENVEPRIMRRIVAHYQRLPSPPPALVLILTDGGIYHSAQIAKLLRKTSNLPIFWQFVGLGQAEYGILEKFDTLSGRVVDNAGFFAVDDIDAIDDETLYRRLLGEFPTWLRAARVAGIPA